MAGHCQHAGGRPWSGPLLISLGLHLLALALMGMIYDRQVRMPTPPTSIKVGLIFKPAPKPTGPAVRPLAPPHQATQRPQPEKPPAARPDPRPIKKAEPKPAPVVKTARPTPAPLAPKRSPPAPPRRPPSTAITAPVPSPTTVPTATVTTETATAPTNSAPAAPRADPAASPVYRAYLGAIRQRIDRSKRYPLMARRGGQQGVVLIDFEINAEGKLCRCEVERSSGFKLLDRAALKAVRAAAPFSPLPDDFDPRLALQLPIRFELGQ
ncbi:hypothetical protein C2E25_02950 [Geothermobacter hydrogeniphilus]|uniref:TonB C-terminal domain-containing protein n=1 Tax=Geothermobacter hydrogeniphilus TaxID=1969733 RepID=A0A2K2HDA1_9BACT|nr:energy transducer TonB [Geothermobacter hydrogeniphilus]PNU21266.1 hypothetical protein C2E25_02950 [Geothermobacter hydrogeniphilus]